MGHQRVVDALVAGGADVNIRLGNWNHIGATALHLAACYGRRHSIVETLISAGADVRPIVDTTRFEFITTALHEASRFGHIKVVRTLIRAGADVNRGSKLASSESTGQSVEGELLWLVLEGVKVVGKRVIAGKGPIRGPGSGTSGRTPLHLASLAGHLEVIEALIMAGANINDRDEDCSTPLDHAHSRPFGARSAELFKMYGAKTKQDLPPLPNKLDCVVQ